MKTYSLSRFWIYLRAHPMALFDTRESN